MKLGLEVLVSLPFGVGVEVDEVEEGLVVWAPFDLRVVVVCYLFLCADVISFV
jgi:hypothetical protein